MGSHEPITGELREAVEWEPTFCGPDKAMVPQPEFDRLCDAIDAVHAQLECDYREACEVNERQDEQYADMVHKLDRAYEKNHNQRKQLTEVQEALHRRNEGELKRQWMREKQDLELQIAKMRLEAVKPPKDVDDVPIRVGDVMENVVCPSVHREVTGVGVECFYGFDEGNGRYSRFGANCYRHYHAPTVEDVLMELLNEAEHFHSLEEERDAISEYAAKLRLAESE